jgi:cyclopropane fatty-acyl-phospholipid synthase-like methyltransferase
MDTTKAAVEIFDKWAEGYQAKFMNVDLYGDSFNLFCEQIPKMNAAVLELGCGPGNITRYLLNKRPDFKILGTDLSPNMIALAQKNNPEASFEVLDCRDIHHVYQKYDAIMCGFCLPYLSKEAAIQLIQDASHLLHPQGVIYISTMEDDYSKSGFKRGSTGDEIYMNYHQADYLTQALMTNGLEIIDLKRQPYPTLEEATDTDLLILARLV